MIFYNNRKKYYNSYFKLIMFKYINDVIFLIVATEVIFFSLNVRKLMFISHLTIKLKTLVKFCNSICFFICFLSPINKMHFHFENYKKMTTGITIFDFFGRVGGGGGSKLHKMYNNVFQKKNYFNQKMLSKDLHMEAWYLETI